MTDSELYALRAWESTRATEERQWITKKTGDLEDYLFFKSPTQEGIGTWDRKCSTSSPRSKGLSSAYLLSMTCNLKSKEITKALFPAQVTLDRPDIRTRDFQLKLESLLHMVYNKELFGTTVAWIKVIEFQKHGVLRAHCIFLGVQ